jgi:sugar lactone lactonase YvrE
MEKTQKGNRVCFKKKKEMKLEMEKKVSFIMVLPLMGLMVGCAGTPAPTRDMVWPLPPDPPRIKFVKSITSAGEVGKESFFGKIKRVLVGGDPEARLVKPYAVHADQEGRVFVVDTGWRKVLVFDYPNGRFFIIGVDGPGMLSGPAGVTTDSEGNIYVADGLQRRVVVYDREGQFIYAIGKRGQFDQPVAVALNEPLARIYVVDRKKHNLQVFKLGDGEFLFEIGQRGTEKGEFNVPTHLFIDSTGRIYVTDTFNFRVQIFEPDGTFVSTFGAVGTAFGHFSKPKGIAVDKEGHIYVADAAFNNVQVFDDQGRLLLFFGGFGYQPGQFWLPAGMDIDNQNRIYVADQYNHRINVYQYISQSEPTSQDPSKEKEKAQVVDEIQEGS